MSKKRIAETINVRINVGNFQHIDITKYAEKEIEYNSQEEMIKKEDELTDELLDNLIRNMRTIPEKLGKKTNAVVEFEGAVQKKIPEWLEKNPSIKVINIKQSVSGGSFSYSQWFISVWYEEVA